MAFSTFSTISSNVKKSSKAVKQNTKSILTTTSTQIFAISNNGQSIIHIAGDANKTVKVSIDYGDTFTTKTSLPSTAGTMSYLKISNNGQYILTANYGNGVSGSEGAWISKDTGGSWSKAPNIPTATNDNVTMVGISSNGRYMYVLIQQGNNGGVWSSNNYGDSFTRSSTMNSNQMDGTVSADGKYISTVIYGASTLSVNNNYGDPNAWFTTNTGFSISHIGSYTSGDGMVIYNSGNGDYRLWVTSGVTNTTTKIITGVWTQSGANMQSLLSLVALQNRICINNDGSAMYVLRSNNEIWVSTDKLSTQSKFTKLTSSTPSISTTSRIIASTNCKYILTSTNTSLYLTTQSDVVEII
jgi:hypothetical protein